MSRLFDDQGAYRLTAAQRTCARCGHILVDEDELGLYYQVPVTEELPAGLQAPGLPTTLTFMDRVHECNGRPHVLTAETPVTTGKDGTDG